MKERVIPGAAFLLLAWIFGAAMSVLVKITFPMANIWTILFFQSTVALICTLPWALFHWRDIITFKSWKLIAIRSAAGFAAFSCLFLAIDKTDLVNAILMNNAAPIFVPFVAFLWLRLKIHANLWWGISLGFIGIILILKPDVSILKDIGVLYGLVSGILFAVIQVALRQLAGKEHRSTILFYYFLFLSCITGILTFFSWPSPSPKTYIYLSVIGVLAFLFQLFAVIAFTYARPSKIATMNYSGIVYSAIAGWILWREEIDWIAWIGILCVVVGGALTLYLDKHNEHPHH